MSFFRFWQKINAFQAGRLSASARTSGFFHPAAQIGLVLLTGLVLYGHTIHAPFLLDDLLCIEENPAIRNFGYLLDFDKIRDLEIWVDIKNNLALRPVAYWTFALNYRFGEFNVVGYHLVNISIHLLNAVLVYTLARVTIKRVNPGWSSALLTSLVPLFVALLFVAHPLQTQAVTYINQRFTSLATLFYLAALLLYIVARSVRRPSGRWFAYGLSLLITVVAMKTKAIAFTLPVLILFYDRCFLDGTWRQRLCWFAPFALTLLVIPGTLYWLVATDGVDDPRSRFEQSVNLANFTGVKQWDYLRTQFGVIATYLRMFLLPVGQNLIPRYPLAPSFFLPGGGLAPFLFLTLLFGGAVRLVWNALGNRVRTAWLLCGFGVFWFFVTIAMSSSIIPLDMPMLEYRVYLPSVGIFLASMVAMAELVDSGKLSFRLFVGGMGMVLVLFSVATYARNDLYNDKFAILVDTLEKNPEALPARVSLASILLDAKRYEDAVHEYTRILQRIPNDVPMLVNLGTAYDLSGHPEEALRQYARALELAPDNPLARGNLGLTYLGMGRFTPAEIELRAALDKAPGFDAARAGLADLYERQGRIPEAFDQYRILSQSHPADQFLAGKVRELTGRRLLPQSL